MHIKRERKKIIVCRIQTFTINRVKINMVVFVVCNLMFKMSYEIRPHVIVCIQNIQRLIKCKKSTDKTWQTLAWDGTAASVSNHNNNHMKKTQQFDSIIFFLCACLSVFALESDKAFGICCIATILIFSQFVPLSFATYNSVCNKNLEALQRFMRSYVNDFNK